MWKGRTAPASCDTRPEAKNLIVLIATRPPNGFPGSRKSLARPPKSLITRRSNLQDSLHLGSGYRVEFGCVCYLMHATSVRHLISKQPNNSAGSKTRNELLGACQDINVTTGPSGRGRCRTNLFAKSVQTYSRPARHTVSQSGRQAGSQSSAEPASNQCRANATEQNYLDFVRHTEQWIRKLAPAPVLPLPVVLCSYGAPSRSYMALLAVNSLPIQYQAFFANSQIGYKGIQTPTCRSLELPS